MARTARQSRAFLLTALVTIGLTGCSGSKVLEEPHLLTPQEPLTIASDERLEVILDWVIVRDGPGTWAKNADWDEYRLRVRNLTGSTIRIDAAAVYDSLNARIDSTSNRDKLVAGSKQTARRYKDSGIRVMSSIPGQNLLDAGTGMVAAGEATAIAAATGYASVGAAGTSVATGAVLLAPVFIVGGVMQSMNDDRVAQELMRRHTAWPEDVLPGEQRRLVVFFPMAPAPQRIEFSYRQAATHYNLQVDTREVLQGMHIDNRGDR